MCWMSAADHSTVKLLLETLVQVWTLAIRPGQWLVHLAVLAALVQWTMAMQWSYSETPCWVNQALTPLLLGNC